MIPRAIRHVAEEMHRAREARATAEALVWHHGAAGAAKAWEIAWAVRTDESMPRSFLT